MGWICKECGAENPNELAICEVCDIPVEAERIEQAKRQERKDSLKRLMDRYLAPISTYGRYSGKLLFFSSMFAFLAGLLVTFQSTRGLEASLVHINMKIVSIIFSSSEAYSPIRAAAEAVGANLLAQFYAFRLTGSRLGLLPKFLDPMLWLFTKVEIAFDWIASLIG